MSTKKIKTLLTIGISFFLPVLMNAQLGLVVNGGDTAGSSGSISYSIGRLDYSSVFTEEGSVSEGLQHPYEISEITSVSPPLLRITASLHPNPVDDYLHLYIADAWQGLEYSLIDISGRLILQERLLGPFTIIDMLNKTSGSYFLILQNKNSQIKTFKIVKP
ncbi:MAG: T9SS type A sorting domain-containing protein [Bacteroidota bacterium]|nr:T9SS type A sorting domain-containing protein [Bacteroidota bacterium]